MLEQTLTCIVMLATGILIGIGIVDGFFSETEDKCGK